MEYLVHSVLSNALVATGLALVPLALGRMNRSPALVHALWLVVLVKLLTPPILPLSVVLPAQPVAAADDRPPVAEPRPADEPSPAEEEPESGAPVLLGIAGSPRPDEASPVQLVREPGDEVPPDLSPQPAAAGPDALARLVRPRWETIALGAMLIGCVGFWSVSAARVRRVQRLVRDLRPASADLEERVAAVAHRLGLRRAPVVALAPGRIPPMLWALGLRTRLLLPADLWGMLTEGEQAALLAHELAHLKRKDHWVRWLDLVVAGLYWWHPVVWLARRGMREAEELCCDAWAVWAVPRGSRAYASALLAALDFVSASPVAEAAPALGVIGGNSYVRFLERRMRMIVQSTTPRCMSWAARLGLLGLAALILPLAPTWAQAPAAPGAADEEQAAVTRDDGRAHEELASRLAGQEPREEADDDDDEDDDREHREHADHLERVLKDLGDQLSKDLGPVAQEVAKALESAAKQVAEAIDKDGIISKDLQKAFEKAREELQESFKSGGSLDKQARESAEKAREDMREAVEKARRELQEAVRERADRAREAARRGLLPEGADEARQEDSAREDGPDRPADLERARREVREMEQQLRRAMRRLEALERRGERQSRSPRRGEGPPPRPPVPPAPPQPPAHAEGQPAPPDAPEAPRPPDAPRGPRGPLGPGGAMRGPGMRGPGAGMRGPGMGGPGGPPVMNPRVERRLRDLEGKMDRLLKELENLKGDKKDKGETRQEPKEKGGISA